MYRQSFLNLDDRAYQLQNKRLQQQNVNLLRQRGSLNYLDKKKRKCRVPTQQTIIQQSGLASYARSQQLQQIQLRRYREKIKRICQKIQELIYICSDSQQYQEIVESQKIIIEFLQNFLRKIQGSSNKKSISMYESREKKDLHITNEIKNHYDQFQDEEIAEIINQVEAKVFQQIENLIYQKKSLINRINQQHLGFLDQRDKCKHLQKKINAFYSLITSNLILSRQSGVSQNYSSQKSHIVECNQTNIFGQRVNFNSYQKKQCKNPSFISQFHTQNYKMATPRSQDLILKKSPYISRKSKIQDPIIKESQNNNELSKVRSHPDLRTTTKTNQTNQYTNEKSKKAARSSVNEPKKTQQKTRHSQISSWAGFPGVEMTVSLNNKYSQKQY